MFKELVTASLVMATAATSAAAQSACGVNAGQPLTQSVSDTDGGTKPNARVTATITADEGHFILTSSIRTDATGTRRGRSSSTNTTPHPEIGGALEPLAAISASFTQSCKHRNIFGTSSCTAAAKIDAIQYPIVCLPEILAASLPTATTN